MDTRCSGVLLPIFSLPGEYGIGSLGPPAYRFLDFLSDAGQRVWQILPISPSGMAHSPYMSPSAFAGNEWFIDLELLAQDGLLTSAQLRAAAVAQPDRADYDALSQTRMSLLRCAFGTFRERKGTVPPSFLEEHRDWLPDYALFMALKNHFGGAPFHAWPDPEVRMRLPGALRAYTLLLQEEIEFYIFLQYEFFRQWDLLRAYAKRKGILLFGDLPFYVSPDSADVWGGPRRFCLDDAGLPLAVAGVPPDAFSPVGQHWGNPLYDWDYHKKTGFSWWEMRIRHAARLYDLLRIDHFRAIHSYFEIPPKAKTAEAGQFRPGPGNALLACFRKVPLRLVAEDLGDLDSEAKQFVQDSGLAGMRVLVQAFDPQGDSAFLPHHSVQNAVIYTSTHDTPTFLEWLFYEADPKEREFALRYLRLRADEGFVWGAVCAAWATSCMLSIAPLQDILGLGSDARINIPGTVGPHNWSWRVRGEALNRSVAAKLLEITQTYRR